MLYNDNIICYLEYSTLHSRVLIKVLDFFTHSSPVREDIAIGHKFF
jgi:hypothetical protein